MLGVRGGVQDGERPERGSGDDRGLVRQQEAEEVLVVDMFFAVGEFREAVVDVVELLAGTYFDASFATEDGSRSWGYFDPGDLSVVEHLADGGTGERVRLSPHARVRHQGSGEDIHSFVLLDPPAAHAASPD